MEPSPADRLQPALLDRLTDEERLVTVFRVTPDAGRMLDRRLTIADVDRAIQAQGLIRAAAAGTAGRGVAGAEPRFLDYLVKDGSPRLSALRALQLYGPGGEPGLALQDCCTVEVVTTLNLAGESADRRAMSMRRLRAAVIRDLDWLLNASGIDGVIDLERYPEVRRSVLNFGLRSLAGRTVSSIDPADVASRLRDAIVCFEPRLSEVRVMPEVRASDSVEGNALSFVVEAELWGQPLPQHLWMRTSIDVDSGAVRLADSAAGA